MQMNDAQTIFTIFYGVYFATVVGITRPLLPFPTVSMYSLEWRSWLRFLASFLLLNVLPLYYFLRVYRWLNFHPFTEMKFTSLFGLLCLTLAGFGFYRIYYGVMLCELRGRLIFYAGQLPAQVKAHLQEIGQDVPRVLPHLFPGIIWVIAMVVTGWACLE